jgi:hypothetical protein
LGIGHRFESFLLRSALSRGEVTFAPGIDDRRRLRLRENAIPYRGALFDLAVPEEPMGRSFLKSIECEPGRQ